MRRLLIRFGSGGGPRGGVAEFLLELADSFEVGFHAVEHFAALAEDFLNVGRRFWARGRIHDEIVAGVRGKVEEQILKSGGNAGCLRAIYKALCEITARYVCLCSDVVC